MSTEPNFMSAPLVSKPENDIYESSQHDSSSTSWYSVPSSTPSPTPSEFFESSLMSLTPPTTSTPLPKKPLAIQNRPSATRVPRESPPHGYQCDLSDGHLPATRIYDASPQLRASRHDRRPRSPPNRMYELDSESHSSSQENTPSFPARRNSKSSRHHHSRRGPIIGHHDRVPTIAPKTLEYLPPWPSGLQLSLSAGNWQAWSRCLLQYLAMGQVDEYTLGLLRCPDERAEPFGYQYWKGNDGMILAYMRRQMSSAEGHYIATCATSAEAFQVLRVRHEKRGRFTQVLLIQKLMQISFGDNPEILDTAMTTYRDLVDRIESIGPIDVKYLGLFFLWQKLKTSHPTVHNALVPAFMDDSITVELLEAHMQHYFEMRAVYLNHTSLLASLSLPAQLPPRSVLCPNCKQSGHTIDLCVALREKTEGLSMSDAITRQHAGREASHQRTRPQEVRHGSAQSSGTLLEVDYDGAVWIGGIRYRPVNKTSTTIAESSELQLTTPDHGEFFDWPQRTFDTILIASTSHSETALLSYPSELPFFLDSGSSNHISCLQSDFINLTKLSEPRRVSGVGNTSVYALGVGTIDLLLPETNARLRLLNTLYVPNANARLVSISQLDRLGYSTTFCAGYCRLTDDNNTVVAVCTLTSSNLYALRNAKSTSVEQLFKAQRHEIGAWAMPIVTVC